MPTVQSDEGSSSTHSITSRRRENVKNRLKDASHHPEVELTVKSQRSSVFRRLGAQAYHLKEEPVRSNSSLRVMGNKVQNQPLHGTLKDNSQLQEVNEMLARLEKLKSELATEGRVSIGSPFSAEIQKEVLPLNVR